jgi:HK97 family phage major capsid protein
MKAKLKRAQENLGKTWEAYREHRDSLPDNEKEWTSEQREKFDTLDADIDKIEGEIDSLRRSIKDAEREERFASVDNDDDLVPPLDGGEQRGGNPGGEQEARTFEAFLRGGPGALSAEQRDGMAASGDVGGGFLISPEKFVKGLLKNVDDQVAIRGMATKHTLKKAASLGVVKLDDDGDDWEWTSELKTGADDDGLKFGKREMRPHPIAKRIKVSETLIRLSDRNVQGLVSGRMEYKLGGTMEQAYMTGDGQNKPLGLFTASKDGISTARDIVGSNTTTALKADTLIDTQGGLKQAYQARAKWLFHRDAITGLRKLKDANNQYLWQPGLAHGTHNMILGKPYTLSEWCPNTFAAGKYVGMYGDFGFYWILDCLNMAIKVLKELYAETNQIGYIGRYEGDGQPVLEEAFARIKMAS